MKKEVWVIIIIAFLVGGVIGYMIGSQGVTTDSQGSQSSPEIRSGDNVVIPGGLYCKCGREECQTNLDPPAWFPVDCEPRGDDGCAGKGAGDACSCVFPENCVEGGRCFGDGAGVCTDPNANVEV